MHAKGVEDAEELRLVARRGLGERDAGADVADPRVAARACPPAPARPCASRSVFILLITS
ncbi:hypothetical protein MCC01968_12330 [Bifidobacteriaceae bacterium MCC01968]|uniref:Uncharacterized protein n=1 Tax=Bifidobacterium breve DSM 20213 = JCM 1192 TaxID=518634 RepID=D4BNU5_BIFBR|nr:hypothetical protein BIFBRE_03748 [Bifidobacterium breve DSM 20213 = JCM 1192]GDZ33247.1 hypothetical protein MCC01961_19150 [Bifidobacteriaceae bacterium MCC01961]GDZ70545.1 hypothetical protein MCC02039_15890 [Bifidobacteriaceae bacterium MCC02039]GDZ82026.1 hypothetical protein MCC01968_12330 [Bifidobacteriaceae bacterium MCC01968]